MLERFKRKKPIVEKSIKEAYFGVGSGYDFTQIFATPYTAEKNLGNLGIVKDYTPSYTTLALRSWQKYYESEILHMLVENYTSWVIGKGLKLQAEPNKSVLRSENVSFKDEQIKRMSEVAESRFSLHANTKYSTYNRQDTLHNLAQEAVRTSFLSGDCLVILRYEKVGGVSAQLVDGLNVATPGSSEVAQATMRGNKITHGVEVNKRGEHVAYYIQKEDNTFQRVSAKGESSGRTTAYLIYGNKYRIDYVRGMPLASVVLETIAIMDRYKTATCSTAEEIAKVSMFIEHTKDSDGESPLSSKMRPRIGTDSGEVETTTATAEKLAQKISYTEEKQVYNMPIGSTIKTLSNEGVLSFNEFIMTNIDLICSALRMPPEVALNKYTSNFSASRMASKSWEYMLNIERDRFATKFYKPFYCMFLEIDILRGKLVAPDYLEAIIDKNYMITEAYRACRFVGANVPHVDPMKEAKAYRLLIGDRNTGELPLISHDRATENLGNGDFSENVERVIEEEKMYNLKNKSNE